MMDVAADKAAAGRETLAVAHSQVTPGYKTSAFSKPGGKRHRRRRTRRKSRKKRRKSRKKRRKSRKKRKSRRRRRR